MDLHGMGELFKTNEHKTNHTNGWHTNRFYNVFRKWQLRRYAN